MDVNPEELKKLHFLKLNSRDLVHTFCQYFTKKSLDKLLDTLSCLKIPHFYCFDAFVRTFIHLLKFKKRVSEGEFPLRSFLGRVPHSELEKNAIFKLN